MKPAGYACPYCDFGTRSTNCNDAMTNCYRMTKPVFLRDDLVRAVLVQQWAVAITLVFWQPRSGRHNNTHENDLREGFDRASYALEDLPCAVDVVAEMLGGDA